MAYIRFRIGSKLSESKSPSQKNILYERYIKNLYKYYKNNLKNWLKNKDKNVDFCLLRMVFILQILRENITSLEQIR